MKGNRDESKGKSKKTENGYTCGVPRAEGQASPCTAKIIAAVIVVYALSPIDLIPDFISVLGYLDDIIILPALVVWCVNRIPRDLFEEYRTRAEGMWDGGKPKKWYYAIPFVLIWAAVIVLIIFAIV